MKGTSAFVPPGSVNGSGRVAAFSKGSAQPAFM